MRSNMPSILISILLAIHIIVLAKTDENISLVYGKSFANGKIIGGWKVSIDDYPYQLSLQLMGQHICGASMIGRKWALTAAHCTMGSKASNMTIRAGTSYYGYGGQVVAVKRVHENPKYNANTLDSDISVVELAHEITTAKAKKISLASWYNFLFPWLSGTATGWGVTKEDGNISWQLRAVKVPIISYYTCYWSYGSLITSNMFCAGANNTDSCQGDSGGPLVVNGKLYGIVSFGFGCGRDNYPGVYTRVSAFRSFIKAITGI